MQQDSVFLLDDKNILLMKLLHYFITEKNYNPIILQGVDNEIWLENMNEDYEVVRIVSSYIHNDEQFEFDMFKTKRIMKKISKKTFLFKVKTLSFFLDLGENVTMESNFSKNIDCIKINMEDDLKKNNLIKEKFPDLLKKMKYSEEGVQLFTKITGEINEHNKEDAKRKEEVFKNKTPYITYILIAICVLLYVFPIMIGLYDDIINKFSLYKNAIIYNGEYYRIFTSAFLHGNILHLLFNCYALYVIGTQVETVLGKLKYILIYIFSILSASLMSLVFLQNSVSIGASGAIFGLMGALLYFGYHYRVYLGNVLKSQLIPLIILNLGLGMLLTGIDNWSHIGGLIGGTLITMGIGIKYKSTTMERTNGFIVYGIYIIFLIYMGFMK